MALFLVTQLTGKRVRFPTLNLWVPYLWCAGMLVFSLGGSVAGLMGQPRRTNLGLTYGSKPRSVLEFAHDAFVISSFSKYFNMTGWRLGWLVLPEALVAPVEKLAQNLYICPSTVSQHAAISSWFR